MNNERHKSEAYDLFKPTERIISSYEHDLDYADIFSKQMFNALRHGEKKDLCTMSAMSANDELLKIMHNQRSSFDAYQPSPYAVVQDIFEEVMVMTDPEYHATADNFDEFLLPSAITANDAIVKMMKIN